MPVEVASTEPVELEVQDCHGDTPLHQAVKMAIGNVLCEEPLIEEMHPEGESRLDAYLRDESTKVVEGFEISKLACAMRLHNKHGFMPIHIAAARGSTTVCEALLKAGAPVNACSLQRDPLVHSHFCCAPKWGKRNADGEITEVPVADKTALHFAIGLLRDKYEVEHALHESDLALVRLLLRYGADTNAADFFGQTPFHIAIISGMHQVVALLADAGADLTTSCRSFGHRNTALHLATLVKDVRMVKLLTEHGASVDAVGRDGWTPLCLAARQGSVEVAKALIDAGADVFTTAGNGKLPLEIAALNSKHSASAAQVLELLQREVSAAVIEIAYARMR